MKLLPFDIEKAKAGAKVVTRDGQPAKYDGEFDVCKDFLGRKHMFQLPGSSALYGDDGKYYAASKKYPIHRLDLFLAEE